MPAAAAQAHLERLQQAGLSLAQIAEVSQVPARSVRRIAAGELTVIKPEHEQALLTVSPA